MVKHFRELRVYREAFDAAMRTFECSKEWPKEPHILMHSDTHTPTNLGRITNPLQEFYEKQVNPTNGVENLTEPVLAERGHNENCCQVRLPVQNKKGMPRMASLPEPGVFADFYSGV